MCRMIAYSSREPRRIAPFLDELARQAEHGCRPPGADERPHEDGYGVAVWTGTHWIVAREQCAAWRGALAQLGELRGTVALLHARLASDDGTINFTKLHPFCRQVGGLSLAFCHNGTIRGHDRLEWPEDLARKTGGAPADFLAENPKPVAPGAIDTEAYFTLVAARIAAGDPPETALPAAADDIYRQVGPGKARSLNAFLSDGRGLVAFRGQVLPENAGYHTLFENRAAGLTVFSTQEFGFGQDSAWKPVDGVSIA